MFNAHVGSFVIDIDEQVVKELADTFPIKALGRVPSSVEVPS